MGLSQGAKIGISVVCPICAPGLFLGDDDDAAAKNTLSIDVSNTLKVISETMVINSTSTAATFMGVNEATIEVGPTGVVTGNINTTQTIDLKSEVSGQLDTQVITNMSTKVISDLKLAADQAAKATADWFSTSTAASENVSVIKNALEQSVTDSLSVQNINTVLSQTYLKNESKIRVNGVVNGDLNIKQGIVADIIARNIVKSIVNRTNEILSQSNSDLRITQNASAEAKGLTSAIDGFVGGITTSSIISAVIICIIIISLLFVALSPSGQKGINKASNVAAARYGGNVKIK